MDGCGDVNGDGIGDFVLGTDETSGPVGVDPDSYAYIVMGASAFPRTIDLAGPPESPITLALRHKFGQILVRGVGDFNGDGYADVAVGYSSASVGDISRAGQVYLLYGAVDLPTHELDLLNPSSPGVTMQGGRFWGFLGNAVDGAGDVNGDGFLDIVLGAVGNSEGEPEAFLIYGGTDVPSLLNTADLDDRGVHLVGEIGASQFGRDVAGVGDVNGDGFDDFLIGQQSSANAHLPGSCYLIYGATDLPGDLRGDQLGNRGVRFVGESETDGFGAIVAGMGDINDDGYDDFAMPAVLTTLNGQENVGKIYLVFGRPDFPPTLSISQIPSYGLLIEGTEEGGKLGYVNTAGDINRDGIDDFMINRGELASVFVVYGRKDFPHGGTFKVNEIASFTIADGPPAAFLYFGAGAVNAGDINGDGRNDFLLSDAFASPYERDFAGTVYVVFGGKFDPTPTETPTLTPTPETTESPTPTMTSTPTATHKETGEFSGWILRGNGNVKVTPERE